jgi:hypothetical protein
VDARIDQDAVISQQLTLWSQRGSKVIRGSLLVIPIEDSLLYIEPLYLAAEAGSIPELRRVIAVYGDRLVMEQNLEEALSALFGGKMLKTAAPGEASTAAHAGEIPGESLAARAMSQFNQALTYQRQGNWAAYGEELKKLEETLRELAGKSK